MKKMRLVLLGAATISMGVAAVSCGGSGNEDEQNASVVNVEKGVASPMWTSEGEPMDLPSELPVPAVPPQDPKEEAASDSEGPAEQAPQENSDAGSSEGSVDGN